MPDSWFTSSNQIAASEIDNGSFFTETLIAKLKNRDIELADGKVTAGDYLLYENLTQRQSSSSSYVKLKEIKVGKAGIYRIKFSMDMDGGGNVYGQIYKNGSAVGTERNKSGSPGTWYTYSEDINNIAFGDLIQIYAKSTAGGNVYIKDLLVYCNEEGSLDGY